MENEKNNFLNSSKDLFSELGDTHSAMESDYQENSVSLNASEDTLINNVDSEDVSMDFGSSEDSVVGDLDSEDVSMDFGSSEDSVVSDLDSEDVSMDFGSSEDSIVSELDSEDVSMDFGSSEDSVVSDLDSEDVSMDFGSSEDSIVSEPDSEDVSMDFGSSEDSVVSELDSEESGVSFDLPKNVSSVIKVIGVGGGGSNAVNHMINEGIKDVDFIICNTDAQALETGQAPTKIQLGMSLTEGLGAGENPTVGEKAALESESEIRRILEKNTKMVFVTAGMGGGTGTGAAPVIAKISKELDILTIGIVTVPFGFEGPKRFKQAEEGIEKIREYVDSLVVINNDKLVEVYGDLGLKSGFAKADETLMVAARGISEVITQNCLVNIDLNDAKTVLKDSGTAIMGSGKASGPNRAEEVVEKALDSPLLNDNHIRGANKILLLVISGKDEITIKEVNEINYHLQREAGGDADIILGVGENPNLEEDISITIIATGVLAKDVDPITGSEERKVHVLNSEKEQESSSEETESISELNASSDIEIDHSIVPHEPDNTVEFQEDETTEHGVNLKDGKMLSSINESVLSNDITHQNLKDVSETNLKRAEDRKKRLQKFHNLNFNNQVVLKELEEEPAYKRQGLDLDEPEHSSVEPNSRVFLDNNEDELEIKNNNSFLHDNVD
jgi:cell division protein FtsZ